MTRSRATQALAERLGKSPGTVERHRAVGMWPADHMADLVRHYEVVEACGLSSGREYRAVALEAAVRFAWPTVLLRRIIAEPGDVDAEALMRKVFAFIAALASTAEGLDSYEPGGHLWRPGQGDVAEGMTADMFDAVRKTVVGDSTTDEDYRAFGEVVSAGADILVTGGVEDDPPGDDTDRPFEADVHVEVRALVHRMAKWREWAQSASPTDLVRAVKIADRIVGVLDLLGLGFATNDSERGREVATLAAFCGAELLSLDFETLLPILESHSRELTKST